MSDSDAKSHDALIRQAAETLDAGGVVLLPTDTVFGLAARPDRPEAVARVFALKARPADKSLPVMVASIAQLEEIGATLTDAARALLDSPFSPGPLTLAVGLNQNRRADWLRGRDELAFRIPDDAFLLELLGRVGPLLVTSANRSGMGTLADANAAAAQLIGQPDLIVMGRECGAVASTLVNCRTIPPAIERIGVIPASALAGYIAT